MAGENGQNAPRVQTDRQYALSTPLGDDVLLFRRMTVTEELGRPFEIDLDTITESFEVDPDKLLGQNVTVRVELPAEGTRYFNGYIIRLRHESARAGIDRWNATIVPWMWFLTRTSDCRIFQDMSVPDIIKQVFRDLGYTDFDDRLSATYSTREYCVQYRETAFDFVSRLMEDEGIYYYFLHEDGVHTLVLIDDVAGHEAFPGYGEIAFRSTAGSLAESERIRELRVDREVYTGVFELTDYDFTNPTKTLESKAAVTRGHENSTFDMFDHPGGFTEAGDGDRYASIRLDEMQGRYEVLSAESDCRGVSCGSTFKLTNHPATDLNAEYLVIASTIRAESDAFGSEGSGDGTRMSEGSFEVEFRAISATQQFRSERTAPTPSIPGLQTAVVVGPSGEEIHTDEHGRVKVMFHWDRYAKADGTDSCWMRVSQPTAGKGWGYQSLPRVGQEVIVEFIEGDPDKPVVTGRVYNGANKPPYELPGGKTITTFKSKSTPDGTGFNEIRFEDKTDDEQVFIHAQKNYDLRVGNDAYETIGNDRHLVVENDRYEHVKNDSHHAVDNDQLIEIGRDVHSTIAGKEARKVGGDRTQIVEGDHAEECKKNMSIVVAGDLYIKADNICIEGETNVTIKVGGTSVALESSGCGIYGSDIKLEADMNIEQNAGMDLVIDAGMNFEAVGGMNALVEGGMEFEGKGGISAKLSGAMAEVSGDGMAKVKGGVTMLG